MRWALTLLGLVAAARAATPNLSPGFDHFYNLEYDEALAYFERQSAADPANPDLHNHIAQTLLFREMLRIGALESEMVSRNNPFLRRPNMNPSPEVGKGVRGADRRGDEAVSGPDGEGSEGLEGALCHGRVSRPARELRMAGA